VTDTHLDQTHNGQSLEVQPGDSIEIRLPENPSTGYQWELDPGLEPALRLVSTGYSANQQTGFGGGGERIFYLKALEPGQVDIEIELKRPWGGEVKDRFRIRVQIGND